MHSFGCRLGSCGVMVCLEGWKLGPHLLQSVLVLCLCQLCRLVLCGPHDMPAAASRALTQSCVSTALLSAASQALSGHTPLFLLPPPLLWQGGSGQGISTAHTPVCHMIAVCGSPHAPPLQFVLWLGCCTPSRSSAASLSLFFAPLSVWMLLVWSGGAIRPYSFGCCFSFVCKHFSCLPCLRPPLGGDSIGAHLHVASMGLTHCISFKAPVRAMRCFFFLVAPRASP